MRKTRVPSNHQKKECQRSAPQSAQKCVSQKKGKTAPQSAQKCVPPQKASLLYSVLGENLEHTLGHDNEELECRRSAPRSARQCGWESARSALPPTVPLTAGQEQENAMDTERDLGHIDNLLGNRQVQTPKSVQHVVHHLRHRRIENLHERADGSQVLHGVPLYPIHNHWRHGLLKDTRPPSH